MKELEIIKQVNPVIDVNFEEVRSELEEKLGEYSKLVVTEDSLSFCKSEQKHLAGLRTKLNRYRIDVKKEMSIPITEFEGKCKELVELVEQAEKPIKDGILVFDEQRKEAKKVYAIMEISRIASELCLDQKYLDRLQVEDKYMNLTAKDKEVTADIEQRAKLLLAEQVKEKEMLETIKKTIERVNKDITQQLEMRDFLFFIKSERTTVEIIEEIEKKANQIKESEEKIKVAQELKAKEEAERVKIEAENKIKEEVEKARIKAEEKVREEIKAEQTTNIAEEVKPIVNVKVEEGVKTYKYTMEIEGTKITLNKLKEFMIENDIKFEVK